MREQRPLNYPEKDDLIKKGAAGSNLPIITGRPDTDFPLGAVGSLLPNIPTIPPQTTNERSEE